MHSVLVNALEQMKQCPGIKYILEDDVEHIHQLAAKIEAQTSRMKDKTWQAFVHSKIEAIQNSNYIKAKLTASKEQGKRNSTKRNTDLNSEQRKSKQKLEWDLETI